MDARDDTLAEPPSPASEKVFVMGRYRVTLGREPTLSRPSSTGYCLRVDGEQPMVLLPFVELQRLMDKADRLLRQNCGWRIDPDRTEYGLYHISHGNSAPSLDMPFMEDPYGVCLKVLEKLEHDFPKPEKSAKREPEDGKPDNHEGQEGPPKTRFFSTRAAAKSPERA